MTSGALVLCEGAKPGKAAPRDLSRLPLALTGRNANLWLKVENVSQSILKNLKPRTIDLFRIALYVYGADTSTRRGTPKDVWADGWSRHFHLVVPVQEPNFWASQPVSEALIDALAFATDDRFTFEFRQGFPQLGQLVFENLGEGAAPVGDLITLFSGGIDSLGAVIDQVLREQRRPVLVSHRSVGTMDARQKQLVSLLKDRFRQWSFPHVSVWASRRGSRAIENTQRSRAFLYLSLAVAVAAELGIEEVRACDNGVMSVNLPRLAQTVGTMATRSTHPLFLKHFQALAELAFETHIELKNPFLEKTRFEVVEMIRDAGHADLIQETVSCARTEGMTQLQRHCGTCTQCVDRRFSTIAADVEEHDLPGRYQKDVFTSQLAEGEERTYAESYIRAATEFEKTPEDQFLLQYPGLDSCLLALPGASDVVARSLIDLHKRHARSVLAVLKAKNVELFGDFIAGRLPDTCLVALLGQRQHLQDDKAACARRIGGLVAAHLPKVFKTRRARKETEVQDATEAILGAAREQLKREVPLLPFGAVTTKPDFAELSDRRDYLFLELKHVTSKPSLRRVTSEMSSRVTVYRDQGASLLFVVYDPDRYILDDGGFIQTFEKHDRVWVTVSR